MKRFLLFSILAILLSSCAPGVMKNISKQLPSLDNSAEVVVYEMGDTVPKHSEVIGGFSISGWNDWESVLETAKNEARAAGGNGLEIQMHVYPSQGNPQHSISAFILNINDSIEPNVPKNKPTKDFIDYVVLREGDTIPCTIFNVTNSSLAFVYGYNKQGYRKTQSYPKSDLQSYHITDPSGFAKQKRLQRLSHVRLSVDGGYTLIGRSDLYSKPSRGFFYSGDLRFYVNDQYYISARYEHFDGFFERYGTFTNPYGYHVTGMLIMNHLLPIPSGATPMIIHQIVNDYTIGFGIQFVTGSNKNILEFLLDGGCEIPKSLLRHRFSFGILLGYIDYQEYGDEFGKSYQIKGSTLGLGTDWNYDFMLTKHLGLGAGTSFIYAPWLKTKVLGINNEPFYRNVMFIKTNYTIGIRIYL